MTQSSHSHWVNNPEVIACPVCDVIHHISPARALDRTACRRCGYKLTLGKARAVSQVVGTALTSFVLMMIVLFAPFLNLNAGQFGSAATVFEALMGFTDGIMVVLSWASLGFVILLPLTRLVLLVWALGPLSLGFANLPGARMALRGAIELKPWAMAEIFMVGVAVALVKLAGMASIDTGPAFWALGAVVLASILQDTTLCRNTLWQALTTNRR